MHAFDFLTDKQAREDCSGCKPVCFRIPISWITLRIEVVESTPSYCLKSAQDLMPIETIVRIDVVESTPSYCLKSAQGLITTKTIVT